MGVARNAMSASARHTDRVDDDAYEAPRLADYGTIETWTRGGFADGLINISIVI